METVGNEPRVTHTEGLPKLLLAIADRMHGDVDGLSKELLIQSAYHIMRLEDVVKEASLLIAYVPRKGKGATKSQVLRDDVKHLANALRKINPNIENFV